MSNVKDTAIGYEAVTVERLGYKQLQDIGRHKTIITIDRFEFPEAIREEAESFLRAGGSIEEAKKRYSGFINRSTIKPLHPFLIALARLFGLKAHWAEGNIFLNEGINTLWNLAAGQGSETNYGNANARTGVGDSTTAEAATQTGLQAAVNLLFKAMDASYPTTGSSQQAVFRSTYVGADANFAWQEFTVDNGSVPNKNIHRKVSAQGTKTSGQTWILTITLTIA